jgi:hypothetical protein
VMEYEALGAIVTIVRPPLGPTLLSAQGSKRAPL